MENWVREREKHPASYKANYNRIWDWDKKKEIVGSLFGVTSKRVVPEKGGLVYLLSGARIEDRPPWVEDRGEYRLKAPWHLYRIPLDRGNIFFMLNPDDPAKQYIAFDPRGRGESLVALATQEFIDRIKKEMVLPEY